MGASWTKDTLGVTFSRARLQWGHILIIIIRVLRKKMKTIQSVPQKDITRRTFLRLSNGLLTYTIRLETSDFICNASFRPSSNIRSTFCWGFFLLQRVCNKGLRGPELKPIHMKSFEYIRIPAKTSHIPWLSLSAQIRYIIT